MNKNIQRQAVGEFATCSCLLLELHVHLLYIYKYIDQVDKRKYKSIERKHIDSIVHVWSFNAQISGNELLEKISSESFFRLFISSILGFSHHLPCSLFSLLIWRKKSLFSFKIKRCGWRFSFVCIGVCVCVCVCVFVSPKNAPGRHIASGIHQ